MGVKVQRKSIQSIYAGQSLLEMVVGIGVVTMVLGGLVSAITFSLSNAQFARNKALATKYAQEAVEWLRSERDASWYTLNTQAPDAGEGQTYCVATFPPTVDSMTTGQCTNSTIDDDYDIFRREIRLTGNLTDDRIDITVTVWWPQGARRPDVTVTTNLTRWQ